MCDHLSSLPSGVKNVLAVLLAGFLFLGLNGCGTTVNQTNLDEAAINQTNVKGREEPTMKVQIPQSINAEHEELHRELEDAIKSGGTTGAAAREVADRLHTHFEKEEEYALPPLGLLKQLAEGKASAEMKETAKLSEKLKTEMPQMLDEHKSIVAALDKMAAAAKSENKADALAFTEKLKMHAQNEEEILYPAAILVGEYIKLRVKE